MAPLKGFLATAVRGRTAARSRLAGLSWQSYGLLLASRLLHWTGVD